MKSSEIRDRFLSFFESKGHQRVDSSSLVPTNDPTLLFTNAGMNQFKDLFLGVEKRAYSRATTSQRCVRAGGKHNDLENVGYTARHHTFFEMLGNFSFGDYFKEEAIQFAWDFLTVELGLPADKLWVTVHESDKEAEDIWLNKMGVSPDRFSHMGDKDNFWMMGDTGPCGPCSEIFYDHGEDVPGGPPGSPDDDLDRYIEIWNLVFMQFDQQKDGSRQPLPKPSVDTGMGLERLSAILQNVHSNYEIDIFQSLIKKAASLTGTADLNHDSLKVISDHIRSASFLVVDGVIPSNEGRGYVLRRIIRRALRHGHKLDCTDYFFHKMVDELALLMGEAYPELIERINSVKKVLLQEEEQFARTLDHGMGVLNDALNDLQGHEIPGHLVFKLYDTYGFPVDLTADIARERNLSVDLSGFDEEMNKQKLRSQAGSDFSMKTSKLFELGFENTFTGYEETQSTGVVKAIIRADEQVTSLSEGEQGYLVFDQTPFYAESGGQIGDTGILSGADCELLVKDTVKNNQNHLLSAVVTSGQVAVGDKLKQVVVNNRRRSIAQHHSATHLLHAALRRVLGTHVQQKGSLVDDTKLRFDFTHYEQLTPQQLKEVEALVNSEILANTSVQTEIMTIDEAKEKGAMALFGEKYGDSVRVLTMGQSQFSVELCGGTHVSRTGDLGVLKITSESGIAAGVRRIEAVAGQSAFKYIAEVEQHFADFLQRLKVTDADKAGDRLSQLITENKSFEKEIVQLKQKLASSESGDLIENARTLNGISYLAATVEHKDANEIRDMVDQLRQKLGTSVVVVISKNDNKVQLAAGVSKDLTKSIKAGDVIKLVAEPVGGKGGGRPDMAMAGGNDVTGIQNAVTAFYKFAEAVRPH